MTGFKVEDSFRADDVIDKALIEKTTVWKQIEEWVVLTFEAFSNSGVCLRD